MPSAVRTATTTATTPRLVGCGGRRRRASAPVSAGHGPFVLRRMRDSNPREGFHPTGFPNEPGGDLGGSSVGVCAGQRDARTLPGVCVATFGMGKTATTTASTLAGAITEFRAGARAGQRVPSASNQPVSTRVTAKGGRFRCQHGSATRRTPCQRSRLQLKQGGR